MNRFLVVALLATMGCAAGAKDKEKCTELFCTKVLGQSGKIRITLGKSLKDEEESMTFELDYIKELDEEGNEVGKSLSKDKKHSLNNFAMVDFTFSEPYNTTVMGFAAYAFNFSAKIPGPGATLVVTMFFITEDGNITLCDHSEFNVSKGAVKFNIEIKDWTFCTGEMCGKGKQASVGKYLEIASLIKSPKDKPAVEDKEKKTKKSKKEKGKALVLDKVVVKFPDAVKADGECKTLVSGYPSFNKKGNKEITVYRFEKFSKYIIYDPIVEPTNVQLPTSEPPTGSASTAKLSVLVAFFAVLVKLLS